MKKKIIKFYGSLFQKFVYVYIHVRVNDEDVRVNHVNRVHMDFCMHAFCIEKTMKKKKFNVHKF